MRLTHERKDDDHEFARQVTIIGGSAGRRLKDRHTPAANSWKVRTAKPAPPLLQKRHF